MKRLFTIILALLFVLPVFAQHSRFLRRGNQPNSAQTGLTQFNANNHFQQKNSFALMQKLDNIVGQDYDVANSLWVNSSLNESSYNSSGINTMDLYSTWNPDTQLYEPDSKQELSYTGGRLTEQLYFSWDASTMSWDPSLKWTYSYDGAGNMVLAYDYYFNSPDWKLIGKQENTYNGDGNLTLQILSIWDESGNDWMNGNKEVNVYNGSGYLTVSTRFLWDFLTNDWKNSTKDEYAYNGSGQQTMQISYSWDGVSSQWTNDYKDDFSYDGNMNVVLTLEQNWVGAQWVSSYKTEISYNNAYTFNQLILPWMYMGFDLHQLFTHMPVEVIESDFIGSSFVLSTRSLFNFSGINITDVPAPESKQAGLFPQPADDYITFEWNNSNTAFDLDLYDINGKMVMETKIENNKSVAIDHLASGLYLYRLTDNTQHSISGKLSVR